MPPIKEQRFKTQRPEWTHDQGLEIQGPDLAWDLLLSHGPCNTYSTSQEKNQDAVSPTVIGMWN